MKHPTLERFTEDTKDHVLTIDKDDGNYRHLIIKKPNTNNHAYQITTWPGYLCISGDMGCYTFSRATNMFDFFRGEPSEINPGYWEEKIQAGAGCSHNICREFDIEKIHERLDEILANFKESCQEDGLADEIEAATEAVSDFKTTGEDSEWDAVYRINNWDADEAGGMELVDYWDGFRDSFTYHYIWCCYAIVHAISLYDEAKL